MEKENETLADESIRMAISALGKHVALSWLNPWSAGSRTKDKVLHTVVCHIDWSLCRCFQCIAAWNRDMKWNAWILYFAPAALALFWFCDIGFRFKYDQQLFGNVSGQDCCLTTRINISKRLLGWLSRVILWCSLWACGSSPQLDSIRLFFLSENTWEENQIIDRSVFDFATVGSYSHLTWAHAMAIQTKNKKITFVAKPQTLTTQ